MGRKNKRKKIKKIPKTKILKQAKVEETQIELTCNMESSKGDTQAPKRMEIWFAKLKMDEQTCVQGGSRPVLIVSNNSYNEHSQTVNVLPMTSRAKKRSMPSHTWIESNLVIGLKTGSMVLAEQVTTIDKSQLEYRMGECTDAMLKASIDKNIRIQLGLEDI